MEEDSPKALFKQQVPKSFLALQKKCVEYAKQCRDWMEPADEQPHPCAVGSPNRTTLQNGTERDERRDPVMNEEEFRYV